MFGHKKHDAGACRVFEYGCLPPTSGLAEMLDQLERRKKLWNRLVEIERGYRVQVYGLLAIPCSPLTDLVEELGATREAIKAKRQQVRSGKVDLGDLPARCRALVKAIKAVKAAEKEHRQRLREQHKERLDALEAERRAAVKAAQTAFGLYWCNWDEVVASYNVARVEAAKKGIDLRFHRPDGTGKVSVRYQHGLPASQVFSLSQDTRLQIQPVASAAWFSPVRAERRKLARTVVWLRVGSDERRGPVWLELPMVMHRPLPTDGVVRAASVIRERVADHWRYKLTVTVATPVVPKAEGRQGSISLDIGWRKLKDEKEEDVGLRVAYWHDHEGQEGQIVLPAGMVREFRKVEDLQSLRANGFNQARAALAEWLKTHEAPDWLRMQTATMGQWRSAGILVMLVRRWAEMRFVGDDAMLVTLQAWRQRDLHLWHYECETRDQLQRQRREQYRLFAAETAHRYAEVVAEDFDLRTVAALPRAEEGTQGQARVVNWQRKTAACYSLKQALKSACEREGVSYREVDPVWSTHECQSCGDLVKFNAARELRVTCPKCGAEWDQDQNAAVVLGKRALSQKGSVAAQP